MHSALLIDELLRQIFRHLCESCQTSLGSAARTSKAWKDPALDALWQRLPSLGPLFLLIPGVSFKNEEYRYSNHTFIHDLNIFKAYACRVKHVSNRRVLNINSNVALSLSLICSNGFSIPNLVSAHISIARCNPLTIPLNISSNLSRLDIDLGFKKQASNMDLTFCNFLEQVISKCPNLRHISFRGLASKRLNQIISTMRNLQSLSLRLGHTLLPETLNAIQHFPYLLELEVHAGHSEVQDAHEPYHSTADEIFPGLTKLHIRARASLVEFMLALIQPGTLSYLYIELDDTTSSNSLWTTTFEKICSKASGTLQHLALEHHFELPGSPSTSIISDTTHSTHHESTTPPCMPFETLQLLHKLKLLRHFSYDLTLPPRMSDRDIDQMLDWWPDLMYLELNQTIEPELDSSDSEITAASLAFFAAKATKLERLILPVTIGGSLPVMFPLNQPHPNKLRNLTIAQLSTTNPVEFGNFLRRLFPLLEVLEGPCDSGQPWIDVNHLLHAEPSLHTHTPRNCDHRISKRTRFSM